MKLYVWVKPYDVEYGSSLLMVVADSEESAKLIALSGKHFEWGDIEIEDSDWSSVVTKLGPPTRVVNLPCAEWHEWAS